MNTKKGVNDNGGWGVLKGDDEFIQLDCHVTRRVDFSDRKVYLHCCPKCNTVVADVSGMFRA